MDVYAGTWAQQDGPAGTPALLDGAHTQWKDRLKHSTLRDATPHTFATLSRPGTSVRAATADVRRPGKPPLHGCALRVRCRPAARGGMPMPLSCGDFGAGDGAGAAGGPGRIADLEAAWEAQQGVCAEDSRCLFLGVEVRCSSASVLTSDCTAPPQHLRRTASAHVVFHGATCPAVFVIVTQRGAICPDQLVGRVMPLQSAAHVEYIFSRTNPEWLVAPPAQ